MFPDTAYTNTASGINSRIIPSVEATSRRRIPTPNSATSALNLKLEEITKEVDELKRSNEELKAIVGKLVVECQELKVKLNNKPVEEVNHGFPGTEEELEQIRVSINVNMLSKAPSKYFFQ